MKMVPAEQFICHTAQFPLLHCWSWAILHASSPFLFVSSCLFFSPCFSFNLISPASPLFFLFATFGLSKYPILHFTHFYFFFFTSTMLNKAANSHRQWCIFLRCLSELRQHCSVLHLQAALINTVLLTATQMYTCAMNRSWFFFVKMLHAMLQYTNISTSS